MSAAVFERIMQETELLSTDEKIALAQHLWSILPANPEIEKAWLTEVDRRRRDAESGKAAYVDWNDIKLVLPNFPYNIVYRKSDDAIYVDAIAHQRRSPNYWSDRN